MASLRDLDYLPIYGSTEDRLRDFLIPVLSRSTFYYRASGYFSSYSLAIAAEGVARLIANGGRMRLLVGAQLTEDDVEAVRQGESLRERVGAITAEALTGAEIEGALRERLEALAWMVARDLLEIKVVLPKGKDGLPIPQSQTDQYYHPKSGIFTDATGDQVMFYGSINESVNGWERHYDSFVVFRSWEGGATYINEERRRLDRLWAQHEPDWIAMPFPEAARQQLLRYTPDRPPMRDPFEDADEAPPAVADEGEGSLMDRAVAQFLLDAPRLLGATGLGAATSAVVPWPHQAYIAERVVETFPRRYLIADEVGLGKTISAGLVIRQLHLSGRARRILILAPKSVLRQWQEELYEKFALNVPAYDGQAFVDVHGEVRPAGPGNPWDDVEIALVSSHLAKRRERQPELLAARPWDLVVVDEAHHARRKDFLDANAYRPNRLLELLNGLEARTRGMLLLTATPMQVHPIEVWDLLRLLGLSGTWAADGRAYLRFFTELRQGIEAADADYVFELVRAETELNGLDPVFESKARTALGPVEWQRVRGLPTDATPGRTIQQLSPEGREWANALAKHHTPLRRLVIRNTRNLLRRYIERGLLDASVPYRDARPVWVSMTDGEASLYDRIEEYITHFYRTYEEERKGLGFVMTVYRRRLTSSFYAVRKSLERRLDFLRGLQAAESAGQLAAFDDDDLDDLTLDFDLDEALEEADRSLFHAEIAYVEDFLTELGTLSYADSKVERLLVYLAEVFRERDTVIVFTQYTDTMDFLRDKLVEVYGRQVGCYSGRGGERYDGVAWVEETKEAMKAAFRRGDEIKILLCTEAASEGLNLQTCGVLVNYDMPWNPMRVEQRIGRIDRIGQRYPEVWVRNYFYEGTVEAKVYRALEDRIAWFENVVGRLQPILGQVGRLIQQAALTPEAERPAALEAGLQEVRDALDEAQAGFDLDAWANEAEGSGRLVTPVTLADLERELVTRLPTAAAFRPHPGIGGAHLVDFEGEEYAVTFDQAVADAYPSSIELLTYGHPLLTGLLQSVAGSEAFVSPPLVRLDDAEVGVVGWYAAEEGGGVRLVRAVHEVREAEEAGRAELAGSSGEIPDEAEAAFEAALDAEKSHRAEHEAYQAAARRSAWASEARRLLKEATLVELAQHHVNGLFAGGPPPVFDATAIHRLRRHGFPFAGLLQSVPLDGLTLAPTEGRYGELIARSERQLEDDFRRVRDRAVQHLRELPPG